MGLFVQKNGFVHNQVMWKDIIGEMVKGGFKLVSANGQVATELPSQPLTSAVLEAGPTVDPLNADQKWRLAVKLTADTTEVFAATPDQITDEGKIAIIGTGGTTNSPYKILAGCIGGKRELTATAEEDRNEFFWSRGKVVGQALIRGTMTFKEGDTLVGTDPQAVPFTYTLSISTHGVALHTQIEGMDNRGCRQAWFVIQRAIQADGTVVTAGKAPLFAMWSVNGGGSSDNQTLDVTGIMRRTVRESDVNTPTSSVSAVQHTPDATAVINPLQQVPFSEEGKFDFRLPQGFNTHRYSYPYELDMMGYASADVISNGVDIEVQVYGEEDAGQPKKRTYIALSANNPDNTGMRVFMLKNGGGV